MKTERSEKGYILSKLCTDFHF